MASTRSNADSLRLRPGGRPASSLPGWRRGLARARLPGRPTVPTGLHLVAAGLLALPAPAPSQTTLQAGSDAALRTNYYWRGLLRDDRAALYPEAWVSLGREAGRLTAGAWTQLRFADPPPGATTSVALGDAWLGASDVWLEAGLAVADGELTLGVDGLLYADEPTGQTGSAVNTTEVYAGWWWDTGTLIPRLRLAVDVGRVGGAYAETGLELRVPTLPSRNPVLSLSLGAVAGWSTGQSDPGEAGTGPAYYRSNGLTHVETSIRMAVGRGPAQVWLEVGGQLARADGASPAGPDGSRSPGSGWWFGLGAADAAILGRLW